MQIVTSWMEQGIEIGKAEGQRSSSAIANSAPVI